MTAAAPKPAATARRDRFYWRAFVTFFVVLSALVLAVSGIVLYIAPPGRIANWSPWTIALLSKTNWQGVHTVLAFLFVVAAGFHVYFNWRVIVGYLKSKLGEGIRRKWELASASGLLAAILVLTIAGLPPFQTVMDLGESAKNSWAAPSDEPPAPHAEEWTVAKLAETSQVPVEQTVARLEKAGMKVADPAKTTLKELASAADLAPREVYAKAVGDGPKPVVPITEGGGWGRKTIGEVAAQIQVPADEAVSRLKSAGIETTASANVREVAQAAGKTPFDLVKVMQGPGDAGAPAVAQREATIR